MSVGIPYCPNTAAVKRDRTDYVFKTSILTGDNHGILEISIPEGQSQGTTTIIKADGEVVRAIDNTPLAVALVWDKSQINLYYFTPSTNGAFLRELCKHDDEEWKQGSLGDYLVKEGVFPHLNATVTAWTDNEEIHVYFKSTKDGDHEITCAKYSPDESEWQARTINY